MKKIIRQLGKRIVGMVNQMIYNACLLFPVTIIGLCALVKCCPCCGCPVLRRSAGRLPDRRQTGRGAAQTAALYCHRRVGATIPMR